MLRNDCIQNHVENIARVKSLVPKYQRILFTLFDDPFNISGILTKDIIFLAKIGLVDELSNGDYQINKDWIPQKFRTVDFELVKGIAIAYSITTGKYSSKFTYYRRLPNE